jgi:hypothetical protein
MPDYSKEIIQGKIFPTSIEACSEIHAPADIAWQVLLDFSRYGEWNTFCPKLESDFELGSPVRMQVKLFPPRSMTQVEYLNVFERYHCAWGYSLGCSELLQANRHQWIEPIDEEHCRYRTVDYFSGILTPVMMLMMSGAIQRGFEKVAQGLKAQAEALYELPAAP